MLKTSSSRITHILRGLPFVQCRDLINHYNLVQKKWLCSILQKDSISDSDYKRMCHPTGLGLTDPNNIADAAYISSMISAMNDIIQIIPDFKAACRCYYYTGVPSTTNELPNHFVDAVNTIRSFDNSVELDDLLNLHLQSVYDIRNLQHDLTEKILKVRLDEINQHISLQPIVHQQLFESFKTPSSRSFLLVTPKNKDDPNTMDNLTFRTCLLQFCILDLPSIQLGSLCSCKEHQLVDRKGIHLKKCPIIGNSYADNIAAHDNLVKMIQRFAQFFGFKVKTEVPMKTLITTEEDDQRRMDLVFSYANSDGSSFLKLLGDVSIISSCTKQQENGTQGLLKNEFIFKSVEKKKDGTYLHSCKENNLPFITIGFTKEGVMSNTTQQLFNMIVDYGSKTLNRNDIQANYFKKLITTSIIKNQALILNKKINALTTLQDSKLNVILKEISAFIEEEDSSFKFPIEIYNSVPYENTTGFYFNDNLSEDSTILDNHSEDFNTTDDSIDSLFDTG